MSEGDWPSTSSGCGFESGSKDGCWGGSNFDNFPTPKGIFEALDKFVIGQEGAKKVKKLAVFAAIVATTVARNMMKKLKLIFSCSLVKCMFLLQVLLPLKQELKTADEVNSGGRSIATPVASCCCLRVYRDSWKYGGMYCCIRCHQTGGALGVNLSPMAEEFILGVVICLKCKKKQDSYECSAKWYPKRRKGGNFDIMPMLLWKLQLQSLQLSSCTCKGLLGRTNESIIVDGP